MKADAEPVVRFAGVSAKGERAKYQAPILRVYGAVSQLTAAKGGTKADGNSGMNMNMA